MSQNDSLLDSIRVIDGGLASELEYLGARIDGPLWSAHVLEDEPEKVLAVHRAYIAAGSQCIATCSYQVSRMGYAEVGFSPERADAALLRSVELARSAAAEFPESKVLIAGSLGPYGAALHNGAEYHGNYDCSYGDLVRFHRERIEVFARAFGPRAPHLHPPGKDRPSGAPICLRLRPSLRSKKPAPSAKRWLPGPMCVHGSASRAATISTSPTENRWQNARRWLPLCRRPSRSA